MRRKLHETHICRDCGAEFTIPYARAAAGEPGSMPTRAGYILVHADGGACHGTPLVDWRCPKCGIAPDMQSTEFWLITSWQQHRPLPAADGMGRA